MFEDILGQKWIKYNELVYVFELTHELSPIDDNLNGDNETISNTESDYDCDDAVELNWDLLSTNTYYRLTFTSSDSNSESYSPTSSIESSHQDFEFNDEESCLFDQGYENRFEVSESQRSLFDIKCHEINENISLFFSKTI